MRLNPTEPLNMKSSTYQFRRCSHFLDEYLLPASHIEVQIAVEMWDFWAGDATAPRDLTSSRTTKRRLNPDHDESAHFQGKKHPMIPDSHLHYWMRSQAHWNQKNWTETEVTNPLPTHDVPAVLTSGNTRWWWKPQLWMLVFVQASNFPKP